MSAGDHRLRSTRRRAIVDLLAVGSVVLVFCVVVALAANDSYGGLSVTRLLVFVGLALAAGAAVATFNWWRGRGTNDE